MCPYAEWHRFLSECAEAGIATRYVNERGEITGFATPLGYALLQRWRWLCDSEEAGLSPEEAEAAFEASLEREIKAIAQAERERDQAIRRAKQELEADEVLSYAEKIGL